MLKLIFGNILTLYTVSDEVHIFSLLDKQLFASTN